MAHASLGQLPLDRASLMVGRIELAGRAKLNVSTIAEMEARGPETLRSGLETVLAVQVALEAVGVEFLNGDSPGVRLRPAK